MSGSMPARCRRCDRGPLVPKGSGRDGVEHTARGLCRACYMWVLRNGALGDYPRHNSPVMDRATVIRRYGELRGQGLTVAEISRRIGIGRSALYQVLRRDRCRPRRMDAAELARLRVQVGLPAVSPSERAS